jgi:expansin (peptidoglycan-binding protein)
MADIRYLINLHNSEESQTIAITGEVVGSGVVYEADMDSAVQGFATALASGASGPALTLDSVRKLTTIVTDDAL